jgi:PAS domain S-box-containing protein
VARVVAVYAEATERGRENLALDRLHRAVPGNTDAAVALLDLEGRTVYASPSHERLLGYREDELVGRGFRDTMHPDDVARAAAAFLAALGGESPTFVARVRHRDGRWVWLEEAPTVILDDGGNPELILTTARDVGDHHATRRPAPARRGRARLRLA